MTYNARPFLKLPLAYFLVFWSLITLLVLSSGPVYAEWVRIGRSQTGTTAYVQSDSIRRKGDMVKMCHLFDYMTVRSYLDETFLSNKMQSQFDCTEERFRILSGTRFSGNMASGKVVYSYSGEGKWVPVVPESVSQILFDIACGKQ